MPSVTADIPTSLKAALDAEVARIKGSAPSVITAALAQYLGTPIHTLFQVSTSGALVAGVYSGVVNVKAVLDHGDFGLGTFANLDGEMVVLDGRVYQVHAYRAAIADAALAHLPRFVIYNGLNAWGKHREVPHPPAQTFHSWYQANRGGEP